MNKREPSRLVIQPDALERIRDGLCPVCGLHRDSWGVKRRNRPWRCCSKGCTETFYNSLVVATSWNDLRIKIFDRDNKICKDCGDRFPYSELIADHIKPIAVGGEQWDVTNIQTLCCACNKVKTHDDHKAIAVVRRTDMNRSDKRLMLEEAMKGGEID